MANAAVVQFEITGKDSAALKRFYASLFGREIRQSPITPGLTFYVEVDDLEEHLYYAEELGGKIIAPPHEIPQLGIQCAYFADPEGHVVGLTRRTRRE